MVYKKRKNIRLPRETYEIPSQIFSVTICTWDRRPLFRNEDRARLIVRCLDTGPFGSHTERYACCLMPDHLHLQVAPRKGNLVDLISGWKSFTANLLKKNGLEGPIWQRGFYDHALRKEEDIRAVAEYIVNNPVRAGLVESWRDYPFSWHRWM